MTVDVRVAERRGARAAADRAFVAELGRATATSSVGSVRPANEANVREAFDRLYAIVESQSHLTLIAERKGVRVGFLLLLDNLPDEVTLLTGAFVAYMAVEAGSRRAGVGAALLSAAENEARRRGLPYMALMVSETNRAARLLYDAGGYQTERRLLCKHL
ncbi:MAG TPA: GNAT family N-acetyltransferase [Candidatus Nitrosotalea sp.]|nr:GNAT family N-acetyltransferase [Candidatus Nitrosotalea sp.]